MFSNRHHASDFHRRQINDLSIAFYQLIFLSSTFRRTLAVSLGIFLIPIKTISFLSPLSNKSNYTGVISFVNEIFLTPFSFLQL